MRIAKPNPDNWSYLCDVAYGNNERYDMTHYIPDMRSNCHFAASGEMFQKLLMFVTENPFGYHKLIAKEDALLEWISMRVQPLNDEKYTVATKCNWIFHGIVDFPACRHCGKPFDGNITVWKNYPMFCGKCSRTHDVGRKNKAINTFKRHKDADSSFLNRIDEKRKKTKLDRYGDANFANHAKARQTRHIRYGGKWCPLDFNEKRMATNMANGHDPNWRNDELIKATNLERYGAENPFGSKAVQERIADTNMKRYGVANPGSSDAIKLKIHETVMERFGVDNPFQSEDVKSRIRETNIDRYGVPSPMQNKDILDRARQRYGLTCVEKYGARSYFASDDFKAWCVSEFGCENPMQNGVIAAKAKSRYRYSSLSFDSAAELSYFIWLSDNGKNFQYKPETRLPYFYDGKRHWYFPDFVVEGGLVEIKGDHFFKDDGTMQNPFDHSQDGLYEAKRQCMIANGVKILRKSDYDKFVEYVARMYGGDFIKKSKLR